MSGRIVGLKLDRGFGFIAADNGSEVFFHASEVSGVPFHWLTVGMRVTFKPASDPQRGLRAHAVQEAA